MQHGVGHFVESGGNSLRLTHARPDIGVALSQTVISVAVFFQGHRNNIHGYRRSTTNGFHEHVVVLHVAVEIVYQGRQRLSIRLRHVKYRCYLEFRDTDRDFFHDRFAVFVYHDHLCFRIAFLPFHLFVIQNWSNDLDAFFTLVHMPPKLVLPLSEAGDHGGVRLLHIDQHDVVEGIVVEPGHGFQVLCVFPTGKQVFNALLDAVGNILQLFFLCLKRLLLHAGRKAGFFDFIRHRFFLSQNSV